MWPVLTAEQIQKFTIRGRDTRRDPVRLAFRPVVPNGSYNQHPVRDLRPSRGAYALAGAPETPFVNPIGDGIVYGDTGPGMLGPPPAEYVQGVLFYLNGQGGPGFYTGSGADFTPLLDPSTLATMTGNPSTAVPTSYTLGALPQAPTSF